MTGELKLMLGRVLSSFGGLLSAVSALAAPVLLEAPNISAVPANQLVVAGNACGPAALLNAFRCGNTDWQRAGNALAGANDRERLLRIIREIGMRPSRHVSGHPRWSRRGVGLADLCDMANEMIVGQFLPQLSEEAFFLKRGESPEALVRRVYQRFDTSMVKGLPPVLSVRRYALRRAAGQDAAHWVVIDAHFVTLTVLPRRLEKHAFSFPVSYIDPWGARRCQGSLGIPGEPVFPDAAGFSSCLEADFPEAAVGRKRVGRGERTVLLLAAAIGRW
jgi:hypothetical protein